jgi:hypothetical protein
MWLGKSKQKSSAKTEGKGEPASNHSVGCERVRIEVDGERRRRRWFGRERERELRK